MFEKSQPAAIVGTVFDTDSDSDVELGDNEYDKYVPNVASLPKHLWWTCCLDAPTVCAPTLLKALIDHGCPPVLILSDLVDIMALPQRKLFNPYPVSGVFVRRMKRRTLPMF